MKIARLHLKAFGAFDDRVLDFSRGRAGFHLVYGPNEAGKSTTLRAITQLLYGIEARTSDDFLHPMKSLRIGARIDNDRKSLECYRRKGNKGTLLGSDDKTILDDDVLAPFLSGVNEETFKNLFGLTHDQLVRGGEMLVQGEGDVGQALFSAAAGIGNLRDLLACLEERAGDLFKPTGTKPSINAALRDYKELRRAIKDAQLRPQEWEELDRALSAAESRRNELDAQIREARADQARLTRIQNALPLVARRLALLDAFEPVRKAAALSEDFIERRHACQTALFGAREAQVSATRALEQLDEELARQEVNEAIIAREETIEDLYQRFGANKKARRDLDQELAPQLKLLEEEAVQTLHHLRPNWTLDQVDELRLAPGQQQHINELSRRGGTLRAHREHAERDVAKLRRQREQAVAALAAMGTAVDPTPVERALKRACQALEAEEALANQRRAAENRSESIMAGIARLGLWSGSMDDLESLPVPSAATIERFRVAYDAARKQHADAAASVKSLESELQQAESQLVAYQKAHDAPSLAALEALRRDRQDGWHLARAAWEAGTPPDKLRDEAVDACVARARDVHPDVANLADAYTALVDAADVASDRLRNEAERVAALAQLETNVGSLRGALERARQAELARREAIAVIDADWLERWSPAGIAPLSPVEMAQWKQSHADLLHEIGALREAREAAAARGASVETQHACLLDALRQAGAPAAADDENLGDCIARAEDWVAAHKESRQQRDRLESQLAQLDQDEIPESEHVRESAEAEMEAWQDEWSALAGALGARATASPSEILALVEAIDGLLARADEAARLRERIARIEREYAEFCDEVRAVAEAVAPEQVGRPEAGVVQTLYSELKRHRDARQHRDRLSKQHKTEAARLREAEAALARLDEEMHGLCVEAGAASADELPAAEKAAAERKRVYEILCDTEAQLLALSPGLGLDEFISRITEENPDSVPAALESLESIIAEHDSERSDLLIEIGNLENQLAQMDGSDDAARLADDAQALLAQVAADAEEYARLKVAAYALNKAIETYRAANQEPLLARAGELFEQLTLGSFSGLMADYDDRGRHVLCGLRPDGEARVHVAGMSEGTADQLYLALRLATLERHLEKHPPIPLVLDDILVNFDDARAGATLKVLGEFSDRAQVIYFTHHEHLVGLAKKHVGKGKLFSHALNGTS